MSDHALFVVAPFVSIAVLVVGVTLRVLDEGARSSARTASMARADRPAARFRLPTIALIGVLLGHVVMFAWPSALLAWSRNLSRLMAVEFALFVLGVVALAGAADAVRRRVFQRADTSAGHVDAAFLGALVVTLVSGIGIAVVYRWAAAWSAMTVTRYLRALVNLQPSLEPLAAMPYVVKLHIFSSFIVVALAAFTGFIGVPLRALVRAGRDVIDPFVAACDRHWRPMQQHALRTGRRLMWSEEED